MIVKFILGFLLFCLMFVSGEVFASNFKHLSIDRVWTGTPAGFAALDTGKTVYIAYYRPDRHMTVAAYDKNTDTLSYRELGSTFAGWDAHNGLALGLDSVGRLHVAGNMHASPLIYGRMRKAGDLDSLKLDNAMIGQKEERVTYPQFLRRLGGELLFLYRSGGSGNGRHYLNVWNGISWARELRTPLFSYEENAPRSAYPTPPVRDVNGIWHMAWVWRTTPDAATNCCLSYARSPDLHNWEDASGAPVALPIEPGEGTAVDHVHEGEGLLNTIKLALANGSTPIISHQKFDMEGRAQVYNAYLEGDAFVSVQATAWNTRWEPTGGGSLAPPIAYSGVMPAGDGRLWQLARNQNEPKNEGAVLLDEKTLTPLRSLTSRELRTDVVIAAQLPPPATGTLPKGMRWITSAVLAPDGTPAPGMFLRWPSYPANRDQPRECTQALPDACHPPAETLELLVSE